MEQETKTAIEQLENNSKQLSIMLKELKEQIEKLKGLVDGSAAK